MSADSIPLSADLDFALQTLSTVLPSHQARFALIGGIATGIRSRLRFTEDIDMVVNVPAICLPGLLEDLISRGFTIDVMKVIEEWSRNQLIVFHFKGIRIDWLKPILPAYQHVLDTARIDKWNDRDLSIASAEGIILTKLLASRLQDLTDIAELLAANQGQLDLAWIEQEWKSLYSTDDPRWQKYLEVVDEYYRRKTNA